MTPRNWIYLAVLLGLIFHGALLPYTYGQTYDAYIHMFFGNHYHASWFDPWETKWYTGFTVTAYPPGSHQLIGLLMHVLDMRSAFIIVQLLAVLLLIVGIYRFSRIWVDDQSAAFAAMLCVFSTSLSETLHIFGQLPTVLSIGLFLNATPHMAGWITYHRKRDLLCALSFTAGATAAHHVTPLFGTIFFVAPVGVTAWIAALRNSPEKASSGLLRKVPYLLYAPIRGIVLGLAMLVLIILIVFPYWHWSVTDPITQVSISHGSRENFLKKPNLGLMFFVIPWGLLILALPYAAIKTLRSSLWPLGLSLFLAFLLGTGGTTPLPKIILGPAFDILTLDRFTFWATLLVLPFAGQALKSVWEGRANSLLKEAYGSFFSRLLLTGLMAAYASASIFTALLPQFRPTQPDFIDPAPIVKFMSEDRHSDWRYLTLGFGDQFAYHSALINAESVDGNYHSARRLPKLTNYSVERLENSKYSGVPGLASLNQFLSNAEEFHLKFVFSNDEFYDPLLYYSGWNRITRLQNGVQVWEKPDISPKAFEASKRELPRYQKIMWGTLPISGLFLAGLVFAWLAFSQNLLSSNRLKFARHNSVERAGVLSQGAIITIRILPLVLGLTAIIVSCLVYRNSKAHVEPEAVVAMYYNHLDFRETSEAFELVSESSDFNRDQFFREQRLTGGLLPSYGKLTSVETLKSNVTGKSAQVSSRLTYLTALGNRDIVVDHTLDQEDNGSWHIVLKRNKKKFVDEMSIRSGDKQFLDLSARNIANPDLDPVKMLPRPDLTVSDVSLFQDQGRFFLVGQIENTSVFPACINVNANALSGSDETIASQYMGRIGAHRLAPGERSPFRIDFEGYLKIQDAGFDTPYDPELFSVPEFLIDPAKINLSANATTCSAEMYKHISLSEFDIVSTPEEQTLNLSIANTGAKIVSTLQLKLELSAPNGAIRWVHPYYLQENLVPGELISVSIPIPTVPENEIEISKGLSINGVRSDFEMPLSVTIGTIPVSDNTQLKIYYDAMTYSPTQ